MKLLRKAVAILAITVMSFSMVGCNATQKTNEVVVAKIGDLPVYKSLLDGQMTNVNYYMSMYFGEDFKNNAEAVTAYNTYLDEGLDNLINSEIVVLKAKERDDIKVTKEEIEEQITELKARYENEEAFNTALKDSNLTLDNLKENLEKNLYVQKLVEAYKAEVQISDEQVSEYYNNNIAQYTKQAGANIYHILVDSEEKANEVLEKYNSGTSFADLAKEYGTDGTKETGGYLDYIPYNTTQYDADFMAGAKELEEGEVSKPVKTQFGWHLIKVDGVQKEDKVQTLDEVKDTIKDTLAQAKAEENLMADVETWRNDYKIETYKDTYHLEAPKETASPSPEASSDAATEGAKDTSSDESKDAATETPVASDAATPASK